ncbi:hypothetical protein EVAR_57791_1 [Eumeta japonica]|uniref:Uncharacterized protein n=1 Tax=Eumeta variegata TaxID=151549 RepID=A0A4C1Y6P2_EUMVA|nr:hypothetical protein EVAR_57791_1 [Eumeta japonica]
MGITIGLRTDNGKGMRTKSGIGMVNERTMKSKLEEETARSGFFLDERDVQTAIRTNTGIGIVIERSIAGAVVTKNILSMETANAYQRQTGIATTNSQLRQILQERYPSNAEAALPAAGLRRRTARESLLWTLLVYLVDSRPEGLRHDSSYYQILFMRSVLATSKPGTDVGLCDEERQRWPLVMKGHRYREFTPFCEREERCDRFVRWRKRSETGFEEWGLNFITNLISYLNPNNFQL